MDFINSNGKAYKVKALPPLQDAIITLKAREKWLAENGDLPPIPTYQITTASGKVEIYEHDDNTEKTTEEEIAWLEYKRKKEDLDYAIFLTRAKQAKLCIDVNPLDDKEWVERMRFLGVELPESKPELLELYADTEVITNANELMLLVLTAAANAGTVEEEVIKELEGRFFRNRERQAAGRDNQKSEEKEGG